MGQFLDELQAPHLKGLSEMFAEIGQGILVEVDPLEDRIRALQEAREAKDIKKWLKAAMPRTYRLDYCELHDYLVETRHEKEHGVEAPRGHAKTAMGCAGIPLYQSLEEPETFDYYLNVQGSEPKALSLNLGIKLEFEQNEVLRAVYGNQVGSDKWTDGLFVLKSGIVFHAVSTGQKLRGTNYRLRRPNWVRLDDAYEDDDIHNPESTKKKNDWIESTLQPMMAADRPTCYCHQGTAINDVDALRNFEEHAKLPNAKVKFKRFAAYDVATKTSLWPELRSFDEWIAKRDAPGVNPTIHAREYLNERRDESSAIVKPSWLHGGNLAKPTWEFDPAKLRFDRDHKLLAARLIMDPSIGLKVENDPTATVVMLKSMMKDSKSADYWILKIVNERLTLQERITLIQDLVDSPPHGYKLTEGRIEAVAGFMDCLAEAKRRVKGLGINEAPVKKDKIAHLESKSWNFQNGKVHISTSIPAPLRTETYNQLTVNHPTHDDIRDAILHGIDDGVTSWAQFL